MPARKGKYAHVVAALPRLNKVDPERQDIVNAAREEILTPNGDPRAAASLMVDALKAADEEIGGAVHDLKRASGGERRASSLANGYALARLALDRIEAWRASFQLVLDAYEGLMVAQMEAEGVASMRMADGSAVSTFQEPYAIVRDPEAFRQFCLADPDLARKMSLPWGTTNALNKEYLLAGEELPGVETFAKDVVRLTKAA